MKLIVAVRATRDYASFHFYLSVEPLVKNLPEIIEANKKLASIIGADIKAASHTQIDRPPCSYNHKQPDGTYDYEKSVISCYEHEYFIDEDKYMDIYIAIE